MTQGYGLANQSKGRPVKVAMSPPVPMVVQVTSISGTVSENLTQIVGTAVSTGAGVANAGAQRVTVAQDSTTVAGSASIPTGANTIGSVNQAGNWNSRTQDGSGTAITSTASALDINIKSGSIANTTFAVTESGTWTNRIQDSTGNNLTSTSSALDVNIKSASITQPVSGTVTANAGTGDFSVLPATDVFQSGTANTTGAVSTQVITGVVSKRLYITGYSVSNSSAGAIVVSFQDGSGGTTLWQVEVPATGTVSLGATQALFRTTAGNGLFFQSSGATTIYCNASGFSQ